MINYSGINFKTTFFLFTKKNIDSYLFIRVLLYFLLSILVVGIFWSIDKGFDLEDEGLYFALSQPDIDNVGGIMNYDIYFKLLYKITNYKFSIIGLRVARFVGLFLFLWFFILFNKKYLKENLVLFVIIFGFFVTYTNSLQTLSYNSLTYFSLLIFLILNIYYGSSIYKKIYGYIILGFLSGLLFLVKPHAGFIILFLSVLISFYYNYKNLSYFIGFLIPLFIAFFFLQYLISLVFDHYSFKNVTESAYAFSNKSSSYDKYVIINRVISALKWNIILHTSGFLLGLALDQKNKAYKMAGIVLTIIIAAFFIFRHQHSNEFSLFQYALVLLTSVFIGYSVYVNRSGLFSPNKILYLSILYLLVYIYIFGSNGYFFRSAQSALLFWWLMILYLFDFRLNVFSRYVFIILFVVSFFKIADNLIFNFSDNGSLLNEPLYPYVYNGNHKIFLKKEQVENLTNLKKVLNKHVKNNEHIIGLYALPGDILLTGYKTYLTPCIWTKEQYDLLKMVEKKQISYKKNKIILTKRFRNEQILDIPGFIKVDSINYDHNYYLYIFKSSS